MGFSPFLPVSIQFLPFDSVGCMSHTLCKYLSSISCQVLTKYSLIWKYFESIIQVVEDSFNQKPFECLLIKRKKEKAGFSTF